MSRAAVYLLLGTAAVTGVVMIVGCGGGNSAGPAATVNGQIISASDGEGISDATVTIGQRSAVTDGSGNYTLDRVSTGRTPISVTRSGYLQAGGPVEVEITAGDNDFADIIMVPEDWTPPQQPPAL